MPGEALRTYHSTDSVTQALRKLDLNPSKGRGQNFLVDSAIARRIVGLVEADDETTILEVGPGLGSLTDELLAKFGQVAAIEIDPVLARSLRDRYSGDDVRVIEGDAMQVPLSSIVGSDHEYIVVANLPYSTGVAIVRRFLEETHRPRQLVVMLQREVAERMAAKPPKMSLLGVATQLQADASLAFTVKPESFQPRPKVDSTVVILETRSEFPVPPDELGSLRELLQAGFAQKRKTLANSLANTLAESKPEILEQLAASGLPANIRAEGLTESDWVRLNAIRNLGS